MIKYSFRQIRILAWTGTGMALLSLLFVRSGIFQIAFLMAGAIVFAMVAQRVSALENFSPVVSKKFLTILTLSASGSFLLRLAILLLTARPAQYGEYIVENVNPFVQFVAVNTGIFYAGSIVLLFAIVLFTSVLLQFSTRRAVKSKVS